MSTLKADSIQPTNSGNNLILKTGAGDAERMRIDTSGNVGIGVSPSYNLHVSGTCAIVPNTNVGMRIYEDSDSANFLRFRPLSSTGSQTGFMFSGDDDSPHLTINYTSLVSGSPRIGIGTASPAVALDVNGEARSSTSTTISSNAKTLTTKDYVDSLTKIGAVNFVVVTNHVIQHQTVSGHFSVVSYSIRCPAGQTWTATLIYWDSSATPPSFTANITDTVGVSTATGNARTFTYAMIRIA